VATTRVLPAGSGTTHVATNKPMSKDKEHYSIRHMGAVVWENKRTSGGCPFIFLEHIYETLMKTSVFPPLVGFVIPVDFLPGSLAGPGSFSVVILNV